MSSVNCSVFSVWEPSVPHLEDDLFLTNHCLPSYLQLVCYLLALACFATLSSACFYEFFRILMLNKKLDLTMASSGVYGFGMIFKVIMFISLLVHDVTALKYVCIGITYFCEAASSLMLMWQLIMILFTMQHFQAFSTSLRKNQKRAEKLFLVYGVFAVIATVVGWSICGIFRQMDNVYLTNLLIAIVFFVIGIGSLAFSAIWVWIILGFKRIIRSLNTQKTESTVAALKRMDFLVITFLVIIISLFFFTMTIFIWYFQTVNGVGMANIFYVIIVFNVAEIFLGCVIARVNWCHLQRVHQNSTKSKTASYQLEDSREKLGIDAQNVSTDEGDKF